MTDSTGHDNPFDAPVAPLAEPIPERRAIDIAWFNVFVVNLFVPLLFGWSMARLDGLLGILAAVLLLGALGNHAVRRFALLRSALITGGILVGLSQVVPLLQIMAGIAGVGITGGLFRVRMPAEGPWIGPLNAPQAFLATILTGALLLFAATAIGLLVVTGFGLFGRRPPFRGDAVGTTEGAGK